MSSDAEMITPPASRRKGNRSTPPKATKGKNRKKELSPEVVDEEEGGDEDEEYEIEEILDCKKGKFAPGRWAFFVSWKGYGQDDNSWVDEPDFFAKEMIEKWWLENPSIKGNPYADKKSKGQGRKSEGASSKVKSRKASSDEEEDSKASSKRKSAATSTSKKRASEEVDATPEVVSEEEERPKKKSRTSTAASKKKQESPPPQNGFFDDAAEGSGLEEHVLDAMAKHMGKKSWEKLIKSIETVERQEDGVLLVYYTSTDGIRAISDSKILADKAPQQLLAFYESHLRWRGAQ
ncbi:hypothetical protein FRC04_005515 [Tulasnella sp. 424]|nr:hypothetical protein FRC04_005515 [Tulasnella sp. 424]KAG8975001.1 hypothetical protein FRC05_006678 [Tulasnella sp. 425]